MGLFTDLLEGASDLVTSPIEVVKDVATLGGLANGQDDSYTNRRLKKLAQDAEDVFDDL